MAIHVPGLISIIIFYLIILAIGIFAARKTGFRATNLKINDVMLANRSIGILVGCFTMTATWVGGGYINGSTEATYASGLVWCQAPVGYSLGLAFSATLKVILDINLETAIIVSAAISLAYTLVGGLYSVAYTDVVQLICMFIGLWLCVPFAMTHDATIPITTNSSEPWLGEVMPSDIGLYMDYAILLVLGGIPWQEQIGNKHWSATDYGLPEISADDQTLTLPLVMRYLCPPVVTFIGLGAVSAAVMSSTDSSILSSSSMFSRNVFGVIYKRITNEEPSETMQVWVMRGAQVVVAVLSCVMAITVSSIYDLFVLCSDFVFVCLFPQLVCVMYLKGSNAYGSFSAFVLGLFFRFMGGESTLGIPAAIKYPWYDEDTGTQLFPFRTLSMLISLFTLICVSYFTDFLFKSKYLPLDMDFYGCFQHLKADQPDDKSSHAQNSEQTIKRFETKGRPDDKNSMKMTDMEQHNTAYRRVI
ncbi:high-affinity choline transporter 1 [Aplysia californica]|uniref:High-affinity choline transporter 1 n=1 Tax=Aplysia californica TaxID=6500 RepID=A0ABM1VQU9_APLCA|nr:high-affinity choline transporter 1 [Aplysia californica]